MIGANPTVNHPVAATWIKNAVKNGTKLIVARPAPHRPGAPCAHRFLQFKPDTDVALLNAMMHVIVTEGLVDQDFIAEPHHRLRGAGARTSKATRPEAMAPICGIDAETHPRGGARCTPRRKASMILWGMGISSTCTAPTTRAA